MQLHLNPLDQPGWRFAQELQKRSELLLRKVCLGFCAPEAVAASRNGVAWPDVSAFAQRLLMCYPAVGCWWARRPCDG